MSSELGYGSGYEMPDDILRGGQAALQLQHIGRVQAEVGDDVDALHELVDRVREAPQSPYLMLAEAAATIRHERADSPYRRLDLTFVRLRRQNEYNLVIP